jgi:glycosyltransferase involved in cell wall biosynthesis
VVTVTLNVCATLPRTIESIQRQTYRSIEHIVVDGGSTDGTIEILRSSLRPTDCWISEPDRGISDAFNKGVVLSRGEFIQFMNADDWMSPNQVETAVETLQTTGADFVFGDLIFYEEGRPAFRYRGDPDYTRCIENRMPALNHPTILVRRSAFLRIGLFDLRYQCAMDYDWLLRLHRAGGSGVYNGDILAYMSHDGVSNTHFRKTIREVQRIAVEHGRSPLLAEIEADGRLAKTALGREARHRAHPLYHRIRQIINRSYVALPRSGQRY